MLSTNLLWQELVIHSLMNQATFLFQMPMLYTVAEYRLFSDHVSLFILEVLDTQWDV